MPALNFKKQFSDAVTSGSKTQTIRTRRKHPIKVGDVLYLKTGMRTKYCKAIGEAECVAVDNLIINDDRDIVLGADPLTPGQIQAMATADGFESVPEFTQFFQRAYGLPFHGVLIKWKLKQ